MSLAMMRLAFLSLFFLAANSAPLLDDILDLNLGLDLDLPWPLPFCASTTTITLGGTWTVTSTSTVTSATSTTTVTAPPVVTTDKVKTTIYSATDLSCISTATTLAPYLAPLGTLAARTASPQATAAADPGNFPPSIIIPPKKPGDPCTRLTGGFGVTTTTTTVTTKAVSTTTTTPTTTVTFTETWVQPTPSAYNGINYYQYINDYNYNGAVKTGFHAGGYETADWNSNYNYQTSGTARNTHFRSTQTKPYVCQLPGQTGRTSCLQWTVVFQGFIHATEAGNYTVYAPRRTERPDSWEDNSVFWWGGEKAYFAYTDDNVDGGTVGASGLDIPGVPNTFDYTLAAGEFLPITFIYSNGQGGANNVFEITRPDGTVYPTHDLNVFVPGCSDSPFVP